MVMEGFVGKEMRGFKGCRWRFVIGEGSSIGGDGELEYGLEVQRHLQLRIEAQGKYLQLTLKKAQETLVEYSSSVGVELAKAELSQLVSMVNDCTSSSFLELTEVGEKKPLSGSSNQANGKKRSMRNTSDGIGVEQLVSKRLELPKEGTSSRSRKSGFLGSFDLNIQCYNDNRSGSKAIDLNCSE
ncbi:hypothetical protein V6N13_099732 [Hibiscus sabdariffa]